MEKAVYIWDYLTGAGTFDQGTQPVHADLTGRELRSYYLALHHSPLFWFSEAREASVAVHMSRSPVVQERCKKKVSQDFPDDPCFLCRAKGSITGQGTKIPHAACKTRSRYLAHLPWSPTVQFSTVAQSCPALCDPMNHSTPGLPVHHQLLESTQTHLHWVGDAIQPSHPLSSPSPPALNLSQHQSLFKWVSSSHQVARVLEFQLQH